MRCCRDLVGGVGLQTQGTFDTSMEKKISIALADDHTIFRDGLRQLLSIEPDFDVVGEANNGTEVLDLVRELQPDILLLDLRMPGLDGLSVLQRIQNQKLKLIRTETSSMRPFTLTSTMPPPTVA